MTPVRRPFSHAICLIALGLFVFAISARAQCTPPSPPSFSAEAGPDYQQITLTVGGIATSVSIEIFENAQWVPLTVVFQNGSLVVSSLPHNETILFRARNYNGCFSDWVSDTA